MKKHILLLAFATLVLTSAIGVQFYERIAYPPVITKTEPLGEVVSLDIPGWESEEKELADNVEIEERILEILNFSDVISRTYKRGPFSVDVWVAYWEPLQMPVRQVGSHTPDVCWVRAGWQCDDVENKVQLTAGGKPLKSAEYREFSFRGRNTTYVYFWHLVGGQVFTAENELGKWDRWNLLKDFARFGMNQKKEQYFVRVSASHEFDNFAHDPGFQQLLAEIAEAGNLHLEDLMPTEEAENAPIETANAN